MADAKVSSKGRKGSERENEYPCYTKGTLVTTDKGECLIEDLVPGDLLLTISGEYAPLKWVGHRTVDCENHSKPTTAWPIRIAQGAFGSGLPKRDLYLSPLHSVYVDNIFIPVVDLINGLTITQEPTTEITYYHLELPAHNVIFAEGLAAESYLDDNNRGFFIGSDSDPVNLIAEFTEKKTSEEIWQQQGFAKVMRAGSKEVDQIKTNLLTLADALLNSKIAA
jgi:Hint domain